MLLLILTALALTTLCLVCGNWRRMQLRRGDAAIPPPRTVVTETLALARVDRRYSAVTLVAAAAASATALAIGPAAFAVAVWIVAAAGTHLYRRSKSRKRLWHSHMFTLANSVLHFPSGATLNYWAYITRWTTADRPGIVVLRCPDRFTPEQFRTAQGELDAAWNGDALLAAEISWGFVLKPQDKDRGRYQIVCHPNPKPDAEHTSLKTGYRQASQLVELDAPAEPDDDEQARTPLRQRLASARSVGIRLGRWVIPAAAAWWIATHPEQARDWALLHPVLITVVAVPPVFLFGWFLLRPRIEQRFDNALKPGRLLLREWLRLVFIEDRLPLRIALFAILAAAVVLEIVDPSNLLALTLLLVWAAAGMIRTAMVARPRTKVVTDMYKIAETHLHYSRHYKKKRSQVTPGPWKHVNVQEWASPGVPGRVVIDVPTGFTNTNDDLRRTFEDEFNEKAFPPDVERGDAQGLNWVFRWTAKYIAATPYVPANPTDVRWHGRVTGNPDEFYVGSRLSDGDMVSVNVQGDSAHILIAGITRSGKTTVGESLVAQRLAMGGEAMIADYKAHWQRLEGRSDRINPLPASTHDDCTGRYVPGRIPSNADMLAVRDMLLAVRDEVDRRRALCGKYKVTKCAALPDELRPPQMFLVFDEFLLMVSKDKGGTDEAKVKNEAKDQVLSMTTEFVVETAAYDINIILHIQRPDAALMGGAMRGSLGCRIACGVFNKIDYQMVLDEPNPPRLPVKRDVAAQSTDNNRVPGRALFKPAPGLDIVPIQGIWFGGGANNDEDLNGAFPADRDDDEHGGITRDLVAPEFDELHDYDTDGSAHGTATSPQEPPADAPPAPAVPAAPSPPRAADRVAAALNGASTAARPRRPRRALPIEVPQPEITDPVPELRPVAFDPVLGDVFDAATTLKTVPSPPVHERALSPSPPATSPDVDEWGEVPLEPWDAPAKGQASAAGLIAALHDLDLDLPPDLDDDPDLPAPGPQWIDATARSSDSAGAQHHPHAIPRFDIKPENVSPGPATPRDPGR